ncbi:hypothetical protein Tco_1533271 [Tanacetum coccineum]
MLESKAYQTYYAFASGEKAPKLKYIRKKADSNTSPKKKHVQATKGTRLKSKAKLNKLSWLPREARKSFTYHMQVAQVMEFEHSSKGNDDTDQGALKQQNVSQESGFKQIEEDAHVTLTPVIDAHKADEPVQSSFVSSDFTSKLLNLENPSPADNEIASFMETLAHHTIAIPEITSGFTTTTPPPPPVSILESEMSKFRQTKQFFEAVFIISGIVDMYLASKMKEAVDVAIQLQTNKLKEEAQAANQEFLNDEVIKTRMKTPPLDQTEGQKKGNLVKMLSPLKIQGLRKRSLQAPPKMLPNHNISLLVSLSMQRSLERINKKKDENTKPKRHNQTRMEKTEKDKAKSKAGKLIKSQKVKLKSSTVSSSPVQLVGDKRPGVKTTNQEPSHTVEESGMQQDQEFIIGDNVEQPADKDVTKADWFKKPERPPTLDPDWIRDHQLTFECC